MGKKSRKQNRDDSNKSETVNASITATVQKKTSIRSCGRSVTAATTRTTASHNSTHDVEKVSSSPSELSPSAQTVRRKKRRSLYSWCIQERQGIVWVWGCTLFGLLFGFAVGSGLLYGEYGKPPSIWRINLGGKIRSSNIYRTTATIVGDSNIAFFPLERKIKAFLGMHNIISFDDPSDIDANRGIGIPSAVVKKIDSAEMKSNPSHPFVYAVLREAIAREKGGYVHPDLGFLEPAPCGAARGIGMVRNLYHSCQTKCVPGVSNEKLEAKRNEQSQPSIKTTTKTTSSPTNNQQNQNRRYMQEEVLIRVPLSYQMTRKVALDTLLPRITREDQQKTIHELDDAALLALLLAHERGVGKYSRWLPYIASLPLEPSCGYSQKHRTYLLDSISALRDELRLDVSGWPGELIRATQYAERIVTSLSKDYGSSLQHPKDVTAHGNIRWAMCQVASRATGGSQKYGTLRMIPLLDMLNHDANAGAFVELKGTERLENGDFVDATEETDGGTFVVRSLRHGRRKALRIGQELLVNYNVPHYSGLDWLVSLGFIPPERYQNWRKLDAPLPRIRRDGPFAGIHDNNNDASRHQTGFFGVGSSDSKAL